ncbi:MAG: PEP/pyruvate-binding domain-containing protein [Thermoanaerobacteraceae bacterium]|nr:PEP/pyruvate-binding domain-containing protein [Thermoanaerobacteraceae bacterium]
MALNDFLNFDPRDNKTCASHILGSGYVGGKAKGLIYFDEATKKHRLEELKRVQIPESYFLTTESFSRFMEINKIDKSSFREMTYERIEEIFQKGIFDDETNQMLKSLLESIDYPLAVRSSSMLEDNIKYSFAGKYFTTFIPNRGSIEERLTQLENAIKSVYASTYGPNAVEYRRKHHMKSEQMAVIIQKLVGSERGIYFYPEIAGVGYSKNYRRWTDRVKVEDGLVRLVFGLGTKCTGRGYARMISLTNINLKPEGNNPRDIAKYSQETFDVLNMETGDLCSYNINTVKAVPSLHKNFPLLASIYSSSNDQIMDINGYQELDQGDKYVFTFDRFIKRNKDFFELVKVVFNVVEKTMGVPVDIEFTYNIDSKIFSLLQARPLSSNEEFRWIKVPDVEPERIILKGDRMLTNGKKTDIKYLVYVDHQEYYKSNNKYAVAREIGEINKRLEGHGYILVGPGRWGSSNPYLGVPVDYSEISNCVSLIEVGIQVENFAPELSYGTHFFADLDADGVLYMPVFDAYNTNIYNVKWFETHPYIKTSNPAVRVYEGNFAVHQNGEEMVGVVVDRRD